MTSDHSRPRAAAAWRAGHGRAIQRLLSVVRLWAWRAAYRRELAGLDDRRLRDVGLTHDQVQREARKPFWMA